MLNEVYDAVEQVLERLDTGGEQSRAFAGEIAMLKRVLDHRQPMTPVRRQVWVGAVSHKGTVVHATVVSDKTKAIKALAEYFRTQEGYHGPAELPGICSWMAEHDERLGIDLFPCGLDLG
jgi:hypothetical protein